MIKFIPKFVVIGFTLLLSSYATAITKSFTGKVVDNYRGWGSTVSCIKKDKRYYVTANCTGGNHAYFTWVFGNHGPVFRAFDCGGNMSFVAKKNSGQYRIEIYPSPDGASYSYAHGKTFTINAC